MEMKDYEEIALQLIATSGTAKSMYVEAMNLARKGKIEEAEKMVGEARKIFIDGHKSHQDLLVKEANGQTKNIPLLIIHAEDQMASVEILEIAVEQCIALYKILKANDIKLRR
ncbi:MAG: PTS lactose/cellobiose transporter subunit IIA [Erysipelotrichia bacterium]|nr:PTS lactose/cellobiose transporter subunit IIA [Erysipelotrichia bacterium]